MEIKPDRYMTYENSSENMVTCIVCLVAMAAITIIFFRQSKIRNSLKELNQENFKQKSEYEVKILNLQTRHENEKKTNEELLKQKTNKIAKLTKEINDIKKANETEKKSKEVLLKQNSNEIALLTKKITEIKKSNEIERKRKEELLKQNSNEIALLTKEIHEIKKSYEMKTKKILDEEALLRQDAEKYKNQYLVEMEKNSDLLIQVKAQKDFEKKCLEVVISFLSYFDGVKI